MRAEDRKVIEDVLFLASNHMSAEDLKVLASLLDIIKAQDAWLDRLDARVSQMESFHGFGAY